MQKLIKTDDYLLVVDDSEIKEGDYRVNIQRGYIQLVDDNPEYYNKRNDVFKKVIAHLPLNNSPILRDVDLLPQLEKETYKYTEEIEQMHLDVIKQSYHSYRLDEEDASVVEEVFLENRAAVKCAEITEKVAIEFGNFLFSKGIEYYDDLTNGVNYTVENKEGIFTMKELFQEFLKTKQ